MQKLNKNELKTISGGSYIIDLLDENINEVLAKENVPNGAKIKILESLGNTAAYAMEASFDKSGYKEGVNSVNDKINATIEKLTGTRGTFKASKLIKK